MCPLSLPGSLSAFDHAMAVARHFRPEAFDTPAAGSPLAGTALKAILAEWLGFVADAGCGCDDMARRMDLLGPDWSEGEGMREILAVMQAEHAKRWDAGRTRLPWSDLAARQLVRLACRRARQIAQNPR